MKNQKLLEILKSGGLCEKPETSYKELSAGWLVLYIENIGENIERPYTVDWKYFLFIDTVKDARPVPSFTVYIKLQNSMF